MHCPTRQISRIALLLALSLLAAFLLRAETDETLGLKKFYGKGNPYASILDTKYKSVQPYTGPYFGWQTDGKPAVSPTKVAGDGLTHVLNGRVEAAQDHADWLVDHAIRRDDAMFFPFVFDFAPKWPYNLKAPWYSALTQGLGLTLCVYLYEQTQEPRYLEWAQAVYASFLVPIEKGGITRFEDDGPFFEEYPTPVPTRVLNGAAVAMIAVHDYATLTGDAQAMAFFRRSVKRLETLLPQYEALTPEGIVASYYSLAPSRTEVLGRFRGSANLFVTEMRIYGHGGDRKTLLETVDVGSPGDHQTMKRFHVWPDPAYMNWGPPRTVTRAGAVVSGREVNGRQGQYDHSPFKFFINRQEKYDAYSIEVSWSGLAAAATAEGQIDVQLYDGGVYWKAGTIDLSHAGEQQRAEFRFPEGFYAAWASRDKSKPTVEERYLDENQALVSLIADLADSKVCRAHARRWKESVDLVPGQWLHELPPNLFSYIHPEPVIATRAPGDESVHAEYPSVVDVDGTLHMYYCAYGDSLRWKLFHATSTDGRAWTRRGEVFGESSLPSSLKGNMAFPHVVRDLTSPRGRLLYFSASPERGKPYEEIHWAHSQAGGDWSHGGVALADGGLDPLVVISPDGQYDMYYTKAEGRSALLLHAVSTDGRSFTEPSTILAFPNGRRGLYTLAGFYMDQTFLLFAESLTPQWRHDTLLWFGAGDRLEPFEGNPLIVDQDWIARWDAIRYGFNFVSHDDKLLLYYNGIEELGAEEGGQIGLAEFDLAQLKRRISARDS